MNQPQENRFTDAEMEIARETDLPDLLESLGYQVKRIGSYHTLKEMDSIWRSSRRRRSRCGGCTKPTFRDRVQVKLRRRSPGGASAPGTGNPAGSTPPSFMR